VTVSSELPKLTVWITTTKLPLSDWRSARGSVNGKLGAERAAAAMLVMLAMLFAFERLLCGDRVGSLRGPLLLGTDWGKKGDFKGYLGRGGALEINREGYKKPERCQTEYQQSSSSKRSWLGKVVSN
jgi:hypothetical protein